MLVAVALSLYCGDDGGLTNMPSPPLAEYPVVAVNKELIIDSWRLDSLKTILDDGSTITEELNFFQTLVFNEDQTFNIENQAGFQTELKNGQWTSTSNFMRLTYTENGNTTNVEEYFYTITDNLMKLTIVDSEGRELLFTYERNV